MRERVEAEAEAILAPYFEALAAGEDLEQRMRAATYPRGTFGRGRGGERLAGKASSSIRFLAVLAKAATASYRRIAPGVPFCV